MSYLGANTLLEFQSLDGLKTLLMSQGWTWLTALNVMVFSLLHFPCGTTLLTIRSETKLEMGNSGSNNNHNAAGSIAFALPAVGHKLIF